MPENLAAQVEQFLLQQITSVEQLETWLLLRSHHPNREWSLEQISGALYSTPGSVGMRLDELVRQGLVERVETSPPSYRYRARDAQGERLVDLLAQMYRERRVAVVSLIYSKPNPQVRAITDASDRRKD